MYRRLKIRLSTALLLALAACGGGGTSPNPPGPPPPPPPPPPAPVATVTVTPNSANLVPQQTQPLTAATLDGAGSPLSGRAVAWATSAGTVATVSSSGLVTAVGTGTATITATSETKTGTAAITVADGGQVTSAGGTVDAAGGAVHIVVPAGAVAAPLSITVTPSVNPPAPPAGTYAVDGTSLTFGPEGTTFTTPVTVTMKYDPAKLPSWVLPGDLALYHYTGGAWVPYTNVTADPVAHTISGLTTGFSPQLAALILPVAVLTPNPASVNMIQRSVTLTAGLQGHPLATGLTFSWTNSGTNGSLGAQSGNTIQYTMTQPALPPGDLDDITVLVSSPPIPGLPAIPSAFGFGKVNAKLTFSFQVFPEFGHTGFGQTAGVDAVARNTDGSIYQGKMKFVWSTTTTSGSLNLAGQGQVTSSHAVYTALGPTQAAHINPRADKISVDFWLEEGVPGPLDQNGNNKTVYVYNKKGSAEGFVEVAPKSYFGSFTLKVTPSGGGSCAAAVVLIPKVTGATSYAVQVTGIVGSSLGGSVNKTVTGPTNTGSLQDVYDAGANLGVPLDGGCNQDPVQAQNRQNLYQQQFAHATILSTVP